MPSALASSRATSLSDSDATLQDARCRAARDKLRIVNEAVEAHESYLVSLDAYENEAAEYRTKREPLQAAFEQRRTEMETFEAKKRLAGGDESDDDEPPIHEIKLQSAFDALNALGPAPTPPPELDHLNERRVAIDGAEGPPLFLLCCGVLEGCGDQGVQQVKELISRGADVNQAGDRPNFGKKLTPLALTLSAMEGFRDPGEPIEPPTPGLFDPLLNAFGGFINAHENDAQGSENDDSMSFASDSISENSIDLLLKQQRGEESPRSVGRLGSEQSWDSEESTDAMEEAQAIEKMATTSTQVETKETEDDDAKSFSSDDKSTTSSASSDVHEFVKPTRPARLSHLKNLVTALLAGGANFEWNENDELMTQEKVCLRPFTDGRNAALAAPYQKVFPYLGKMGTSTRSALFLACLGIVNVDASLNTRLACVDITSRLLTLGADCNETGSRPGKSRLSGTELTPFALLIASMESDAVFGSSQRTQYNLDAISGNPNAMAASLILAATKSIEKEPVLIDTTPYVVPMLNVDQNTTFTHVPTLEEYRQRRVVTGHVSDAENEKREKPGTLKPCGPHLWHAACAAAEGAGVPAVAVLKKLLKLGANPDAVGSRPGHCVSGTPTLTMCVHALRGKTRDPKRLVDQPWWPEEAEQSTGDIGSSASGSQSGSVRSTGSQGDKKAQLSFEGRRMFETPTSPAVDGADVSGVDAPGASDDTSVDLSQKQYPDAHTSFGWVTRANSKAVDAANAIAVNHRDTRVKAAAKLAESIVDLQNYVPSTESDRVDRESRSRMDLLSMTDALLDNGADANCPMRVINEYARELKTDLSYPLGIAVGLFADGLGDISRQCALLLLKQGRNVNVSKRGVTCFPLVAPPLYAATVAIRRNVPQSVDLWRLLIEKGADVNGVGLYIEGTKRTVLIELLHTLREGVVFRPGVLSLIKELLELGCHVRQTWPEVYLASPHPAYGYVENTPFAEVGENSVTKYAHSSVSLLGSSAVNAATQLSEELGSVDGSQESGQDFRQDSGRNRDATVRVRLSDERIDELVATLSERYGFDVTHAQVREMVGETKTQHVYTAHVTQSESVSDASMHDADNQSKASSVSTSGPGPGAYFPLFRQRVGTCIYAPLFWAFEAVCGDGFDEGRQAVEAIVDKLNGDVDQTQGLNHHSYVQGSLVAMGVAAAIEAAKPMAPFEQKVSGSNVERGALVSESEFSSVSTGTVPPVPEHSMKVALETQENVETEGHIDSLPAVYKDLECAAKTAAAQKLVADAHRVEKLPAAENRSKFRSRARGVLGASRFDRAIRKTAREKAAKEAAERLEREEDAREKEKREANRARTWRGVGTRTAAGYFDSRNEGLESPFELNKIDDAPGDLDEQEIQLHLELDEMGAPSQVGKGDDVGDLRNVTEHLFTEKQTQANLLGALNFLLFGEDTEVENDPNSSIAARGEAYQFALRRYEKALSNSAKRLAAVQKVAKLFLNKTKKINAPCVNPLLAEVGAASLAPYEYTALFFALHGGAVALCAEQMEVADELVSLCLDLDADVSMPGSHATVGGLVEEEKFIKAGADSKTFDVEAARRTALQSYPLMWAVAVALRHDNPLKNVDDVLETTKRILMKGADPTLMNIQVKQSEKDEKDNASGVDTSSNNGFTSKVLHLWDERCLLLEVFDQHEWQRVMTLRLKLQKYLTECGARSAFRVETGMTAVAKRAAPYMTSRVIKPENHTANANEKAQWAAGVRRTRELLEHGGVPSQYAVWVWPVSGEETYPQDDALIDVWQKNEKDSNKTTSAIDSSDSKARRVALASTYAGGVGEHKQPSDFGAPARPNEIEVKRKHVERDAVVGTVNVSKVTHEDAFFTDKFDDRTYQGVADFNSTLLSKQLATRLLWEDRVDTSGEREDAARRASVLAVRELLKGEPEEPSSSDSESEEELPQPPSSESDASEYESKYKFVPVAKTFKRPKDARKKSRGVVHAVLVWTGFRKKKEKELLEKETETAWDVAATRPQRVSQMKQNDKAVSHEKTAKVTLSDRRTSAISSIADALMVNKNAKQSDRWKGTKSLAEMARLDAAKKNEKLQTEKAIVGKRLIKAKAFPGAAPRSARDESLSPPQKAFGALGKYMQAVEREEQCDWNAVKRRPVRRLLT